MNKITRDIQKRHLFRWTKLQETTVGNDDGLKKLSYPVD